MSFSTLIFLSSIGASIELLLLSGAGAFLAFLGYFDSSVSAALSKALYQLFIPALVFGSVLETTHTSLGSLLHSYGSEGDFQEIWIPLTTAAVLFTLTGFIAFPLTHLCGFKKHKSVRRALFACLFLGNANTMPLIVMQSLCDTFSPIQGNHCYSRSMGYASLFMTAVNVVSWTFLFQYLASSTDNEEIIPETECLIPKETSRNNFLSRGEIGRRENPVAKALLSPPFVTVLIACFIAVIPGVANCFLNQDGILRPIIISTNTLGNVVVPISCMLVGAELFRSFSSPSRAHLYSEFAADERFELFEFLIVPFVRLILLPLISRMIFSSMNLSTYINCDILRIFVLVEFNVPTANNTVIMITIISGSIPRIGSQLRQDVSKCVFYQFLLTPVFLTINTAAALNMLFPTTEN